MTRPPNASTGQKRADALRRARIMGDAYAHGEILPSAPPSQIDLLEREASQCRALAAEGFMPAAMRAQAAEVEARIAKLRRKPQ